MSKSYIYSSIGADKYKVIRLDESLPIGHKDRIKEYIVDLKNGDMLCSCPSFMYKKVACKHIKDIFAQLRDGGGIINFGNEDDYEKLLNSIKKSR